MKGKDVMDSRKQSGDPEELEVLNNHSLVLDLSLYSVDLARL